MNNDTITINGFNLSEVINIIEIIRPVGNERNVTTNDAPLLGVNLQEVRTGAKIIKVKFAMQYGTGMDLETVKHKLAGVFNTSEAVKVVISDEPDKYYMGLVTGSVDMDNVTRWFQKGSFDILIPDGVAHSSTYKRFDNGQEQRDKIVFDIKNDGNVPAFPVVKVKNNSENGYIGLVNTSGALEIGDREETDTGIVKRSEVLLDFRDDRIADGFAKAIKNVSTTNSRWDNIIGTSELVTVDGKKRIRARELTGGLYNTNYGTGLSWEIPADSTGQKGSLNDYIFCKLVYQLDSIAQCGFIKVSVSDLNGRFLYGIETYKRYNGLYCGFNIFEVDSDGEYSFLKTFDFDSSSDQNRNPFAKERGQFEIKRNDDRLQVYYNGSHYSFVVPEIKGKKSAKIHVTIGGFYGKSIIPHLYLDELMYRKDFVTISDIPNRYPIGSNIVLNSENDTVTVDGIEKIVDIVQGSKFLSIPPGKSQLEVYCSSWVKTKPTVTVEFKERYL